MTADAINHPLPAVQWQTRSWICVQKRTEWQRIVAERVRKRAWCSRVKDQSGEVCWRLWNIFITGSSYTIMWEKSIFLHSCLLQYYRANISWSSSSCFFSVVWRLLKCVMLLCLSHLPSVTSLVNCVSFWRLRHICRLHISRLPHFRKITITSINFIMVTFWNETSAMTYATSGGCSLPNEIWDMCVLFP